MPKLEWNHITFPSGFDIGWYDAELSDGRVAFVALMECSPGNDHWVGCVEDPDICECEGFDMICDLCDTREGDYLVATRVTGCYRSPKSAINALQQWVDHPEGPTPASPWYCPWTLTQIQTSIDDCGRHTRPEDKVTFGRDQPLSLRPRADGGPPPPYKLCNHAAMIDEWLAKDTMPSKCSGCDTTPRFVHMPLERGPELGGQHGLPEKPDTDWVIGNAEPHREAAIRIAPEQGVKIATFLHYRTDCAHDEEECDCPWNADTKWRPDKYIVLTADAARVVA